MLRTFLLSLTFLFSSAFSLFTEDEVKSYPVQNGSIDVDGKLDSVWVAILNERENSSAKIDLSDCSKAVFYVLSDSTKCKEGNLVDSGAIELISGYDGEYIYLFFNLRVAGLFDGSALCGEKEFWKLNAIEFYLDPHQWDTTEYRQIFYPDANNRWFGTSSQTIQINKPAHPSDKRILVADRTNTDTWESRDLQTFLESRPEFAFASSFLSDSTSVGVEFRIPRYADFLESGPLAGNGVYFTFGYVAYPKKSLRDCSEDVPVPYSWSKQVVYQPPDYPGGNGWYEQIYSPSQSREAWGKLSFQPEHSQNISKKNFINTARKIQMTGTQLYLPGKQKGQLLIHDYMGKFQVSVPVREGVADLGNTGLKQGLYFGKIDGNVYFIPFRLY